MWQYNTSYLELTFYLLFYRSVNLVYFLRVTHSRFPKNQFYHIVQVLSCEGKRKFMYFLICCIYFCISPYFSVSVQFFIPFMDILGLYLGFVFHLSLRLLQLTNRQANFCFVISTLKTRRPMCFIYVRNTLHLYPGPGGERTLRVSRSGLLTKSHGRLFFFSLGWCQIYRSIIRISESFH